MVKVKWTTQAVEDIFEIQEYYNSTSKSYAKKLVDKFFEKGDLLEKFPDMGRKVPEFNKPDIRELIYKSYRIIYKNIDTSNIHVLTIHNSLFPLSEKSVFD